MAEKIKIVFLGTGSSIPTKRRNHPAVLLKYKNENILVDCGEGTQRQFRKAKTNPCKLTRILITHWHLDHALGIPGLFKTLSMNGYNKTLMVYGPKGTKTKIRAYFDLFMIKEKDIRLEVHEVEEGVFFENNEFCLEAIPADHGIPTVSYSFVTKEKTRIDKKKLEKLKIPNSPLIGDILKGETVKINGKSVDGKKLLFKEPSKKITFVFDTRMNNNSVKLSKNSDLLVIESTYSKDEKKVADEHGHLTSEDAATIAKKAKVKKLALVHLSQRYEAIPKLILGEAKKIFKNVFIPEDLDGVEV